MYPLKVVMAAEEHTLLEMIWLLMPINICQQEKLILSGQDRLLLKEANQHLPGEADELTSSILEG